MLCEQIEQIDGVAMGSPLGPALANAFLCYHEGKWIESCPSEFRPVVYKRYVDDIFLLFRHSSHLSKFQEYMNTKHSNIRFTSELESNNCFNFLDILIERSDSGFITSVYRKPTFSGVYSNFFSFIHPNFKFSLVWTLLFRSFNICSSYDKFHNELIKLKAIFQNNEYPLHFIDNVVSKFLNRQFSPKPVIPTVPKKQILFVMPYLGMYSNHISAKLHKFIAKAYPHIQLKLIFKSQFRLASLFKFKDTIPTALRSCVVYKFKCGSCNATYYGKTRRHFHHRVSEHLGVSDLTGKQRKSHSLSAVSDHCMAENHSATASDFRIISSAPSDYHLRIKEALLISRDKPSLNNQINSPLFLSLF